MPPPLLPSPPLLEVAPADVLPVPEKDMTSAPAPTPPMPPPAFMTPELSNIMSKVEVAEFVGVASISINTPLESTPS